MSIRSRIWRGLNATFIGRQRRQARRFQRSVEYRPQQMSLTDLADYHGSDKGDRCTFAHGYTHVYERWLQPLRQAEAVRLLEIGVDQGAQVQAWAWAMRRLRHGETRRLTDLSAPGLGGASLKMWRDYLPNAQVHGLDLVDRIDLSDGRITVYQCDQADPEALQRLMQQTGGGYDVIFDDGSHASLHQQISFCCLFEHLRPGGQYIIEDLMIHPPFEKRHRRDEPRLRPTHEMVAHYLATGELRTPAADAEQLARLVAQIDSADLNLDVGRGVCRFVRRRSQAPRGLSPATQPSHNEK